MAATDFDVVIDGVKAKTVRGEETPGYDLRYVRQQIEQQLISQAEDVVLSSRGDLRQMYQKSWAGGAAWWKPLLGPQNIDSYYRSNHMDVWSEPGKVVPGNRVVDGVSTSLHDDCVMVSTADAVYAIGSTNTTNASFLDVYKWTPASDAFVRETAYHSGIAAADQPLSAVFDESDGFIYVLCEDASAGRQISRFNPTTPTQTADWLTNATGCKYGASIVRTRHGLVYTAGGDVYLIDKSGPSETNIFAVEAESLALPSGGSTLFRSTEMMTATPEGIYLIRNVQAGGQYEPWLYRIDRDAAGNWIGNPFAPLPKGSVALSVGYHLGSIIIPTSPEPQTIIDQTEHAEVILYQYTEGQPGALGSILGRGEVDETPYGMLGTQGPLLFIGGHKRLWIYDAIRGGIHSGWEWGTLNTLGPYRRMAWVRDNADDGATIFIGPDRLARIKRSLEDDPDTVTNFGDDETHYTLESNYFDGNLPFEEKELSGVEILRDAGDGDQEWTVQVAADDGAFADVLEHSANGETHGSADLTGTTGRRFRYKLIYQTKDTQRTPLRALIFKMSSGKMIREWQLILDGEELLNVDNEVVDPEKFVDDMKVVAAKRVIIALSDNMQEQGQETDTGTTTNVIVQSTRFLKTTPGETTIQVILREAA